MTRMDTMREATERLEAAGFADSFQAEAEGLRALRCDRVFAPEDLVVEEVARFEGASDPDDEATVFALRSLSGDVRGIWVVGWGPQIDPVSATCLRRLRAGRRGVA
jgi:hypothetical protein